MIMVISYIVTIRNTITSKCDPIPYAKRKRDGTMIQMAMENGLMVQI